MVPDENELDDEIRGHLALSIKERIERGEDPESARLAAMKEFGNLLLTRESMRGVWRHRLLDAPGAIAHDLRVALRSLSKVRGMAATVVVTLALGIGANAAIVSVVREVLLRPLVNRDEDRLIYIRQSAPGLGRDNLTFSVPEINDLRSRVKSIAAFGDFSVVEFTLAGLGGEPRVVRAGVVGGSYFEVMGLRPAVGRLLNRADDGPDAARVAVLTNRFWSTSLRSNPAVVGKTVRLDGHPATIVGVLEPSLPYPADTEIIANVVSSAHHLGATMVTERTHRMTELFGRLASGVSLDQARAELAEAHAAMRREHPETYSPAADVQVIATPLREQLTAPARTVLLVLLAAAGVVFVIACSNVANLILARSVHRQGELAVRAALGASNAALRRTLLAESLVLCTMGAVVGVVLAGPLVTLLARYASRFSVRALDVTLDVSLLWVGAALAIAAAIVLAYVPRLPSPRAPHGFGLASGSIRITPGTSRRLRAFAITQTALSFVLLAGAGMLLGTLLALQRVNSGYHNMSSVLAIDVPKPLDANHSDAIEFYQEAVRRVRTLPDVRQVAVGSFVPWRDVSNLLPAMSFSADGHVLPDGAEPPRARLRNVTPGFFAALGVPILEGRDFTESDRRDGEQVVIVSQSLARTMFPGGRAIGRRFWWTEPLFGKPTPRRIIGVVPDLEDERLMPGPALTVYHPLQQLAYGGRLFVHASGDPYQLVPPIRRVLRELSPDQPVERAATLQDVRAEVLAPDRLNAFVFSAFAGVALLIAVVGVAGVLAFSVSARTREFGVRLAIGSTPRELLAKVLSEGALIAALGTLAGGAGGFALARIAAHAVDTVRLPGALPLLGAAAVLIGAAAAASLIPAARASRVDVLQVLRSE